MNRPAPRRDTEAPRLDLVGAGLLAFGVYQIAIGLFMAVAPGTFFEELAAFGVRNDHYIRDLATFELPLGVVLLAVATAILGWLLWRAIEDGRESARGAS